MNTATRWILPIAQVPLVLALSFLPLSIESPLGAEDVGIVLLLLLVFVLVLGCYIAWYCVAAHDLSQITGTTWSWGIWAALLVVPFASLVSLYKLAEEVRRAQLARGVPGLALIPLFLLNLLPSAFFTALNVHGVLVAQAQVHRAVRGLAPQDQPELLRRAGLLPAPEVLPTPAPAVLALLFGWASVPLGLFGPGGVVAGLLGLFFRSRFMALEAAVPGHRGARLVSALVWVAWTGIMVGAVVTGVFIMLFGLGTTTVSAK